MSSLAKVLTFILFFSKYIVPLLSRLMFSDGDCVFQREVTVDVWRNLTDSAREAKMPSDEFFQ